MAGTAGVEKREETEVNSRDEDTCKPGGVTERIEEALTRHRSHVDEVLPTGDPAAIKRLYVEMGDLLESTVDEAHGAPLLSLPETVPVVLRMLNEVKGLVLDAGCGPYPAVSIGLGRKPGRTIVAMDIGLANVRLARAAAERSGVRVLGVAADLERLPFHSGAFTACVCDDTIEHLPDDRAGVSELARVLAPRGRVVITTPNRNSLTVLSLRLRDWLRGHRRPASSYYAASSHLREYPMAELESLLEPVLIVRRRGSVPWTGNWRLRMASRICSRGPLLRFGRMIVVEAEPRYPVRGPG